MNQSILFNDEWLFTKQKLGTSLEAIQQGSIEWERVDIPHDWLIYQVKDLYETSEGWYKRQLSIHEEDLAGHIILRFEGVYMDSTLFVNGKKAGEWKYGYSTFEHDITEFVSVGTNELLLRVVHKSPNTRWYSGAGIYRNVWLRKVPRVHLVSDGIYIVNRKEGDGWDTTVTVEVDTTGIPADMGQESYRMEFMIYNKDKALQTAAKALVPMTGTVSKVSAKLRISNPELWDITNPVCYQLVVQLMENDAGIQQETCSFGYRTTRFDCNKGFFLNDRHLKLNGVCMHHDLGCLGAAMNRNALRRQYRILKAMGVNAIRTSHNMPAVETLELADEMGILLIVESFDCWEHPKTTYDYARFFDEWVEKDVASWIRRDRNHPSAILWSIGNEIYDTHAYKRGAEITRMLMELVHFHDPAHNAHVTLGSNFMSGENAQKCADIYKIAGYNYAEYLYREHHAKYPDWVIYGSETGSTVQSRGIYHFPASRSILADDDEQCSSLDNSTTSWGARNVQKVITDDRNTEFSLGTFVWSGFDYIGEPTPYHTKNSYFGLVDTAGFPKDAYYIYQAEWTDYHDAPMVHIFPYWDFNEGQLIDVRVCSNAPRVELFFDEESLGAHDIDHRKGLKLLGEWQLRYRRGILKAVAYDENGRVIATDVKKSFQDACSIVLKPDKRELLADGRDLIFVEISMKDLDGNPVDNANNRVRVSVEGAGRLIGLDNGNSTDYDEYKGTSRRLFSGKLLAVIAAKLQPGEIIMTVSSEGMRDAMEHFIVKPCEKPSGISAMDENRVSPYDPEIPIRKIELSADGGNILNADWQETALAVKLYPANATYREIEWRVTNDAGIDTNIASVSYDKGTLSARVCARGDGSFRLRATASNGEGKVRLISELEFRVEGLGKVHINPYEFVTGGLFSRSNKELGNGNERGVATAREGTSYIVYDDLDFGEIGSDTITIPIFELSSAPLRFEIWEGMPYSQGSEKLCDALYDKPSIWNRYQEEAYRLSRRLTGITSLGFVFDCKVHMKGFIFTQWQRAFATNPAKDNSGIYGDTFTVTEKAIENIGNNVSIEFDGLDFGSTGSSRITICGHSGIEKNTIHIKFTGDQGEVRQMIEFPYSDGYVEREFHLERIVGKQKITFIFLPGCRFDFQWFRFEEV